MYSISSGYIWFQVWVQVHISCMFALRPFFFSSFFFRLVGRVVEDYVGIGMYNVLVVDRAFHSWRQREGGGGVFGGFGGVG